MEPLQEEVASEPSLEDDLREASSSILHKKMAEFQLEQHKNMEQFKARVIQWGNDRLERGEEWDKIKADADMRLWKGREYMRAEREQVLTILEKQKATRDLALNLYLQERSLDTDA